MKSVLKKRWLNGSLVLLAVLALSLGLAAPALAGSGTPDDPTDTVPEDTVIEGDLFMEGNIVRMEGRVEGDLFAAGQFVYIDGEVEGNVFAVGQVVEIHGVVDGMIFAAGQVITLDADANNGAAVGSYALFLNENAKIDRNLYFGGFSLITEEGSQIERNLYAAGYQARLDGNVNKNVTAGAVAFELNGTIDGDLKVEIQQSDQPFNPGQFMMGPPVPVSVPILQPGLRIDEANVGGEIKQRVVTYQTPQPPQVEVSPAWYLFQTVRRRVGEFIGLLLIGLIMMRFASPFFEESLAEVRERPMNSAGYGILVLVLYPFAFLVLLALLALVVIFLSLLTLGELTGLLMQLSGLGLSAFIAAIGLFLYLIAKVLVAYLVGEFLLQKLVPSVQEGSGGKYWNLVTGLLIYELLRAIPLGFGWVVALIVVSMGGGALFITFRNRWQARKTAA